MDIFWGRKREGIHTVGCYMAMANILGWYTMGYYFGLGVGSLGWWNGRVRVSILSDMWYGCGRKGGINRRGENQL
jgi:hypothetical protein